MSLAKTLIKVAIGIAVAKGVSTLVKGGKGADRSDSRPGGMDDIMAEAGGARRPGTGHRYDPQDAHGGGLDDLLGELTGQKPAKPRGRTNAPKGGLEDLMGGGQGGSLGDLLGQLTGATQGQRGAASGGGLGDLLGAVLGGAAGGALTGGPSSRQEDLAAALILRAMVAAIKSDGEMDAGEKRKLTEHLDGATQEEIAFINAELERRTDVDDLASQVPEGMEAQIYVMSLMAINLDNRREAQYLDQLAKALSLDPREVNALHDRAGVAPLYS